MPVPASTITSKPKMLKLSWFQRYVAAAVTKAESSSVSAKKNIKTRISDTNLENNSRTVRALHKNLVNYK